MVFEQVEKSFAPRASRTAEPHDQGNRRTRPANFVAQFQSIPGLCEFAHRHGRISNLSNGGGIVARPTPNLRRSSRAPVPPVPLHTCRAPAWAEKESV